MQYPSKKPPPPLIRVLFFSSASFFFLENQEYELKVDAGDRECQSDGDIIHGRAHALDEKKKCDNIVEVLTSDGGDHGVEKEGCEVTVDFNGVADEVHSRDASPDAAEKVGEVTADLNCDNGGWVEEEEDGHLNATADLEVGQEQSLSAKEDHVQSFEDEGLAESITTAKDEAVGVQGKEKDVTVDANNDNSTVNGGCLIAAVADLDLGQKECEAAKKEQLKATVAIVQSAATGESKTIERKIGHYSNRHRILLVGEGDFSFAACLAEAFGDAANITATSLDDRDTVISKYSMGEKSMQILEDRGATVIHGVDAHTMNRHPELRHRLFDRVVFNFPHHGFIFGREHESCIIKDHQTVVEGFFRAAKCMVGNNGEIHVTHKTAHPFDRWNIEELAEEAGLALARKKFFCRWSYPGYVNRKAYGFSWDSTFPVGECYTFMFSCN